MYLNTYKTHQILSLVSILLVSCFTAACSVTPTRLPAGVVATVGGTSSAQKIGVVSMLSESIQGTYAGVTIFTNHYWRSDPMNWSLNVLAARSASDLLAQAGITRVELQYDSDALFKRYQEATQSYSVRVKEGYGADIPVQVNAQALRDIATANRLDVLILLAPGHDSVYCQPGSEKCANYGELGYGVINQIFGFKREFSAYISINVFVIDAKTVKTVARNQASSEKILSFTERHDSVRTLSTSQLAEIRAAFDEMTRSALKETLDKMGFRVTFPR